MNHEQGRDRRKNAQGALGNVGGNQPRDRCGNGHTGNVFIGTNTGWTNLQDTANAFTGEQVTKESVCSHVMSITTEQREQSQNNGEPYSFHMCTSMRLIAQDGSSVIGRTMEFPITMDAELSVIPRGITLTSGAAGGVAGKSWTTEHGVVGISAFPTLAGEGPIGLTDGMNEAGMYGGLLYQPGFCQFPPREGVPADQQLIPTHVIAYVLSTCTTVQEAREALAQVTVWDWDGSPVPLMVHFRFDDSSGNGIVVEWINGVLTIFENPIGVLTNSPHFDWHINNLRVYLNLEVTNPAPKTINNVELKPLGIGAGMLGLPGDATPPARFVRAAAYVATVDSGATAATAENMMLHLVNNFDLPAGFAVSSTDPYQCDQTLWSTICNSADKTLSVRMQLDHTFRTIAMKDVDFSGSSVSSIPLPAPSAFPEWKITT